MQGKGGKDKLCVHNFHFKEYGFWKGSKVVLSWELLTDLYRTKNCSKTSRMVPKCDTELFFWVFTKKFSKTKEPFLEVQEGVFSWEDKNILNS